MAQCIEDQNAGPSLSPWRLSVHNSPLYELLTESGTTPHRTSPEPYQQAHHASLPHDSLQPIPTKRARNRWWHRIGISGLFALSVGTFFILASCAILIFLWSGADATRNRNEPVFWQTIVARGWATRVVTICSAVIRTFMALQVGLITAATASIMLERSGASLIDTPVLSMERALKGSPLTILPAALKGNAAGGISGWFHTIILATALLITFVSTFMSTILLSDFTSSQIAAPATTSAVAITSSDETIPRNGASYWKSRPSAQWRFAEAKPTNTSRIKGDTGDTYRALLPFLDANTRTSLEYYAGPAVVTNFRTFCMAPDIINVTLEYDGGNLMDASVTLEEDPHSLDQLGGTLVPGHNSTIKGFVLNNWSSSWTRSGWPLSLYHDSQFALDGGPVDALIGSDPVFNRFLIFNSSGIQVNTTWNNETSSSDPVPSMLDGLRDLSWKKEGLWTKFVNPKGSEIFSATSCLFNIVEPQVYNVTMSGRVIKSEPDGNLNLLPSKTDTEKILRQFGVGAAPVDFANRGVLDLEVGPRLTKAEVGDPNINVLLYYALRERTDNHSGGWALTEDLPSMLEINDWSAHISQISTFQSIIQETKDPAIAVQVLLSRLYQMSYYDWSKEFNVQYPITMVHAIDMLIPTRWIGLFMVLCLVGLHFALCFVTLLLFVSWTKTSVLGNSWQAVAQIISPQTRDILELADVMSDREVKKVVKATGRDEEVYTVSRSTQYGRMQIQPFSAN